MNQTEFLEHLKQIVSAAEKSELRIVAVRDARANLDYVLYALASVHETLKRAEPSDQPERFSIESATKEISRLMDYTFSAYTRLGRHL